MIPNISRNGDAAVLTSYLVGPGRVDEHLDPHLVGGSPHLLAWYTDAPLSHEDALDIGGELNQAASVLDVHVTDGHVWHCSLSLHPEDGVRTDEEWEAFTHEFMESMGLIGVEGKPDVTWAAFRHGVSGQNGNDHIHIAASLVRPDGTKADTWHDYERSQDSARKLEAKHGLLRLVPGHGARGYKKGEVQAAERRGRVEPERATLARVVRASAVSSESEGEFVRRLRRHGVLVKPSFTSQDMDKVNGYAVAMVPPKGFRPMYSPGHKLAGDLGLGVLRQGWKTTGDRESVDEWLAAKFGKRMVVADGRDSLDVDPGVHERAVEQLADLRNRLRSVPFENQEEWRRVAAFASGAYASWSVATEPVPGELARVSDELAKSAQVSKSAYRPSPHANPMGLYSATALALAAHSSDPGASLAVFVHMSKLARSVMEFNKAREDRVRELSMMRMYRRDLSVVSERLHEAAGVPLQKAPAKRASALREPGPVMAPELKKIGHRVTR